MGQTEGKDNMDVMWLVNTPVTDGNFKSTLERASQGTINAALTELSTRERQQTKVAALERRLRKLEGGASDEAIAATADRQVRTTEMEVATLQDERDTKDRKDAAQVERERMIAQCHKAIGQVQTSNMFAKFATVSSLVWLKDVKANKLYRDIPGIGTWEKFCDSVGMSRQKVDEDLANLAAFGEEFLTTCQQLSVGYRELRKLRQLTLDGSVVIDAECIRIGEEAIPINEDHADDLQVAIERIIEDKDKLSQRVEKLEKNLDAAVAEETKGLKSEVKTLVKEVKRLKVFDPEEKDQSWCVDQLKEINGSVLESVAMISRFIVDDRAKEDPVIMGQVEGQLQTIELALAELRKRWENAVNLYEA